MSRKSALKDAYDMINFVKGYYRENNMPLDKIGDFIREKRKEIRRINRYSTDPLAQPMTEEWRHVYDEDGESGYDFCIMVDDGETEDEIREYAESAVGYPPICSPYDCTGKRFTRWISVNRVPMGFAVIHSWGLDV